jgi:hypothetical protein
LDIEDAIWNNFCYWNFVSNFIDFELNWRFCFEFEFLENWSLREIVTSNINPPELRLGQGVPHDGLQTFLSDLVDLLSLALKIEEVMKF